MGNPLTAEGGLFQELNRLGVQGLDVIRKGKTIFVDCNASQASDVDDGIHGYSWEQPVASLNGAMDLCTADEGDLVLVAPGHYEDLGDSEAIDIDVDGVTVQGLGVGAQRPLITFDHADGTFDVGADDATIRGLVFRPSVTSVKIGVDVESSVTGVVIEDCEFAVGEKGDGTDEFIVCIDLKSGNHDTIIRNNVFRTHADCDGCTTGISLTAASSRVRIENNLAVGNWSTAFIDDGEACTDIYISGNRIKVKDGEPGIELTATTTGIIANNLIESTGINPDAAIVAADCSWFGNYVVSADGSAAALIGTQTALEQPIGSVFYTVSTVTSSYVPNNTQTAAAITGAASGSLILEDIVIQTNGTGLVGPTNFEISTDNVYGKTGVDSPIWVEATASLGANVTSRLTDATSHLIPLPLENGKKLFFHGDDGVGTGAGVAYIYCKWRRRTAGATIAAASLDS